MKKIEEDVETFIDNEESEYIYKISDKIITFIERKHNALESGRKKFIHAMKYQARLIREETLIAQAKEKNVRLKGVIGDVHFEVDSRVYLDPVLFDDLRIKYAKELNTSYHDDSDFVLVSYLKKINSSKIKSIVYNFSDPKFKEGLMYYSNKTRGVPNPDFSLIENDGYLIVIGYNPISGKKYIFLFKKTVGEIHHSSFTGGAPVLFAGSISVNNHKVYLISNHSGHYCFDFTEIPAAIEALKENKVPISKELLIDTIYFTYKKSEEEKNDFENFFKDYITKKAGDSGHEWKIQVKWSIYFKFLTKNLTPKNDSTLLKRYNSITKFLTTLKD